MIAKFGGRRNRVYAHPPFSKKCQTHLTSSKLSESSRSSILLPQGAWLHRQLGLRSPLPADRKNGVPRIWNSDEEPLTGNPRSEERRVGKECRSRWSPY